MSWDRARLALPNAISATNMVLGLVSVAMSAAGRFEWAAWLIVYSTILDKADGAVARALGAGSAFGMEMDSFSDLTSFGIAPAALTWFALTASPGVEPAVWVGFASATWVLSSSFRLARFNLVTHEDADFFTGLPTTAAAGVYATLFLSLRDLGVLRAASPALPALVIAFAVLMVSGLRISKIKRRRSGIVNLLQGAAMATTVVLSAVRALPEVLLVLAVAYLLAGSLAGRRSG